MKQFTFAVDPPWANALAGEIDIVVVAETEKEAYKKAFDSLEPHQQNMVASLDCVDEVAV